MNCLICKGKVVRTKFGTFRHANPNRDVYDYELRWGRTYQKLVPTRTHAAVPDSKEARNAEVQVVRKGTRRVSKASGSVRKAQATRTKRGRAGR